MRKHAFAGQNTQHLGEGQNDPLLPHSIAGGRLSDGTLRKRGSLSNYPLFFSIIYTIQKLTFWEYVIRYFLDPRTVLM